MTMNFWTPAGFGQSGFFQAGGFDARSIPDLVYWRSSRYSSSVTLDTSTGLPYTVSQMNDLSGNGNHAKQTSKINQPVWDTAGKTAPYFDGDLTTANNDRMIVTHSSSINLTALTGFAVAKRDGTQNFGLATIFRKLNATSTTGWLLSCTAGTTDSTARLFVNGTSVNFPGTPFKTTEYSVMVFTVNAGNISLWTDNIASPTTGTYTEGGGIAITDDMSIGARNNGNNAAKAWLPEDGIYNRILSGGEIDVLRLGLMSAWK